MNTSARETGRYFHLFPKTNPFPYSHFSYFSDTDVQIRIILKYRERLYSPDRIDVRERMAEKKKISDMTVEELTEEANKGYSYPQSVLLGKYTTGLTVEYWDDNAGWIVKNALDGDLLSQTVLYRVVFSDSGSMLSDDSYDKVNDMVMDALEQGNLNAVKFMSIVCIENHDYIGAAQWCMKGVKYGIDGAEELLDDIYIESMEDVLPPDDIEIPEESDLEGELLDTVTAFAAVGYAVAQFDLAYHYAYEASEVSYEEAFKWFEKAAEHGHADSEYNLGVLCLNGCGTEKSPERARGWFSKAVEHGCLQAKPFLE